MSFWKRFKPNRDCNNEAHQAEMLDVYTRWLKGERLSRKHKHVLKACQESAELEPLRQLVDFAHHRFEETGSIESRPGARERIGNAIIRSVSQPSQESDAWHMNDIGLQPVYSPEQVGSESELAYPPTSNVAPILFGEDGDASLLPSPADGKCTLKLRVIQGDQVGREYNLVFAQMFVGRDADSAIHLKNNANVSRRHALLSMENEELHITDLDSRNGTNVDGQPIFSPTPIYLASQITIGGQTLEVVKLRREDGALHVTFTEIDGADLGQSHTVTVREMSVGRGSAANLRIADSTRMLSRRHARFELTEGQIYLKDLDSTNGTYVDESRIDEPTRINEGAVVKFGGIAFEVTAIEHS